MPKDKSKVEAGLKDLKDLLGSEIPDSEGDPVRFIATRELDKLPLTLALKCLAKMVKRKNRY